MTINALIQLLEHVKKEKGGQTPVVFVNEFVTNRKEFDIGEEGRHDYNACCTSPYEVNANMDGMGRYNISLRSFENHPFFTTPTHLFTEDQQKNSDFLFKKLAPLIHKRFVDGYCDELDTLIKNANIKNW